MEFFVCVISFVYYVIAGMDMLSLLLLYVDNCFNIRQRYNDSSQHEGTYENYLQKKNQMKKNL